MAIEILDFMANCPIFILYIIIQIVILVVDFVELNYIRAFAHFWLGFIFFIGYQKELCSNKNINLGINQALIVLSFLFFQWFLINWAFSINNMNTQEIVIKEKNEKKAKKEQAKREYSFVQKQLGIEDRDLSIDADIRKQTKQIRIANIDQYNLNRGDKIYLPDGEVRTIIGFQEEFI